MLAELKLSLLPVWLPVVAVKILPAEEVKVTEAPGTLLVPSVICPVTVRKVEGGAQVMACVPPAVTVTDCPAQSSPYFGPRPLELRTSTNASVMPVTVTFTVPGSPVIDMFTVEVAPPVTVKLDWDAVKGPAPGKNPSQL